MLDTILTYDAANGGVQAVVSPTSLTIKGRSDQRAYLVGHFLDGISVNDCTITCATNPEWEAAGFAVEPTTAGIATSGGPPARFWAHKIPVQGGDVLVLTSTSGNNPTHAGIYVEYPWMQPNLAFQVRKVGEDEGHYVTKATTAGGTNCAAGTLVQGATNLTGFMEGRTYTPVGATISAAFTTTAFLGLRRLGANNMFIWPTPLTDIAQAWQQMPFPKGVLTAEKGDQVEVFWSSVTAEQPTGNVRFVY